MGGRQAAGEKLGRAAQTVTVAAEVSAFFLFFFLHFNSLRVQTQSIPAVSKVFPKPPLLLFRLERKQEGTRSENAAGPSTSDVNP